MFQPVYYKDSNFSIMRSGNNKKKVLQILVSPKSGKSIFIKRVYGKNMVNQGVWEITIILYAYFCYSLHATFYIILKKFIPVAG